MKFKKMKIYKTLNFRLKNKKEIITEKNRFLKEIIKV